MTYRTHLLVFRVIQGDVYELPVYAGNRGAAVRRGLFFLGLTRSQVIMCEGA